MARDLGLEQLAQLLAAIDGLVAGAVAQGVEDGGGGLHPQVAGDERRFQLFERRFVDRAGERNEVFDLG